MSWCVGGDEQGGGVRGKVGGEWAGEVGGVVSAKVSIGEVIEALSGMDPINN